MNFDLVRTDCGATCTIGALYFGNERLCYTLEDIVREEKVYGETAIPAGVYEVEMSHSARFKRVMPILLNVPGFVGIRIHGGNTDADTHGCILLGMVRGDDSISNCKPALDRVYRMISDALADGMRVTLTIKDLTT